MFRRGECVAGRCIHHHDAQARGRVLVDIVGAYTGAHDGSQLAIALDRFGGNFHAAADDSSIDFSQKFLSSSPLRPCFSTNSKSLSLRSRSSPSSAMGSSTPIRNLAILLNYFLGVVVRSASNGSLSRLSSFSSLLDPIDRYAPAKRPAPLAPGEIVLYSGNSGAPSISFPGGCLGTS